MSECGQTWEVSQILNQASSEKFSCLSHVEPKNLPGPPKQEAMWSGPLSIFAKLYFTSGWSFGSCWSGLSWLGSIAKDLFHWLSSTNFCNSSIYRRDLEKIWLLVIYKSMKSKEENLVKFQNSKFMRYRQAFDNLL